MTSAKRGQEESPRSLDPLHVVKGPACVDPALCPTISAFSSPRCNRGVFVPQHLEIVALIGLVDGLRVLERLRIARCSFLGGFVELR